jgi:hypothetical protein
MRSDKHNLGMQTSDPLFHIAHPAERNEALLNTTFLRLTGF